MPKKSPTLLRALGIGLKDGLIILVILATISPFVYKEVLSRTSSNSDVVLGSIDGDLPDRPPTATPEPVGPTATPTVTPTMVPQSTEESADPPIDGGFIHLSMDGLRAGLWTQVQWLAGDGNWYDVNGWGGELTAANDVLWFVGKDHLGAEPVFRWQIYDGEGGALLATSDSFHLPMYAKETIHVTTVLPTN
jgi:hypothetical protein